MTLEEVIFSRPITSVIKIVTSYHFIGFLLNLVGDLNHYYYRRKTKKTGLEILRTTTEIFRNTSLD